MALEDSAQAMDVFRRLLRYTGALMALALAIGTSVADARRPAMKAEKRAIVQHGPPRCQTVFISTVNPRFASSQRNDRGRGCLRYAGDGIGLYEKRNGRWTYVSGMSDCTPAGMAGVPHRVYRELTRVYCRTAPSTPKLCAPDDSGVDDLRVNGLKCGSAHKVARRWLNADGCPTKGSCSIRVSGARWDCYATRQGRQSDVSCSPTARPKNVQFAYAAPAPYLTDDEAVDQILDQLTDDGAIASTEDVEWNYDPCERESRADVTCTYWYENGQGRWEGRTRVRETADAYVLKDLYVESRP